MSQKIIGLTLIFISTLLFANEDEQQIKRIVNDVKATKGEKFV